MRTENEIRRKIDSLLDVGRDNVNNHEYYEAICCQIDALLWVIGDESGDKPLDERRIPNVFVN